MTGNRTRRLLVEKAPGFVMERRAVPGRPRRAGRYRLIEPGRGSEPAAECEHGCGKQAAAQHDEMTIGSDEILHPVDRRRSGRFSPSQE